MLWVSTIALFFRCSILTRWCTFVKVRTLDPSYCIDLTVSSSLSSVLKPAIITKQMQSLSKLLLVCFLKNKGHHVIGFSLHTFRQEKQSVSKSVTFCWRMSILIVWISVSCHHWHNFQSHVATNFCYANVITLCSHISNFKTHPKLTPFYQTIPISMKTL